MTKELAIQGIVENIITLRDIDIENASVEKKLKIFANRYYDSACAITGYAELPESLVSFVEEAVLQAWNKRGSEGLNMQSAVGVSEQYLDVEYALRTSLKGRHNPLGAVFVAESGD
jgi:hypothetical protein